MRRGINIRKKNKIAFQEINKKSLKLIGLLIFALIICMIIYFFFIQDIFIKENLKQDSINFSNLNENVPFSLKKIIIFSSATAKDYSANQLLSLDISQYCDIGIYLNMQEKENLKISSLYVDNISISSPEIGTPYLYQKIVSDFGKCTFSEDNIINDRFNFNIITPDQTINYLKYEAYNNGSSPISLGFYNKNIKTNFMPNNSEILYNGTLLKDAAIPLSSLDCTISFTINIITNSDEHYICNVTLKIPFESENMSIYTTGHITHEIESNETNKFIRIK